MLEDMPLSEAKRALLEKYLRGDLPQTRERAVITSRRREAEESPLHERVVPVQTGGSKRPFFFLHGQWDGGFFCFPLARDLGPDQPFYALDPYTYAGLQCPPTLETIAAAHIKSLRAVQPDGPYLLGGYCNGALVAYEMARQLHANGQRVDLLALIDPMSPGNFKLVCRALSRLSNLKQLVSDFGCVGAFIAGLISGPSDVIRLSQSAQLGWFLRMLYLYVRLRDTYLHVRYPLRRKSLHPEPLRIHDHAHPTRIRNALSIIHSRHDWILPALEVLRQDYEAMFTWVASKYAPDLYPSKVIFFWNSAEHVYTFRRAAWRDMLKHKDEVEVHVLPGTHATLRDEHINVLAGRLRACLDVVRVVAPEP